MSTFVFDGLSTVQVSLLLEQSFDFLSDILVKLVRNAQFLIATLLFFLSLVFVLNQNKTTIF